MHQTPNYKFQHRHAILKGSSRMKKYKRVLLGTFFGRLQEYARYESYTTSHP